MAAPFQWQASPFPSGELRRDEGGELEGKRVATKKTGERLAGNCALTLALMWSSGRCKVKDATQSVLAFAGNSISSNGSIIFELWWQLLLEITHGRRRRGGCCCCRIASLYFVRILCIHVASSSQFDPFSLVPFTNW